MADTLRFERFDKQRHQRGSFDCGQPALNEYLHKRLNQQMKRGVTVGYVLAADSSDLSKAAGRIAGYVTLSAGELPITVIPAGHGYPPRMPLPTTLIGRLAVDRSFQGQGLGADLLIHALRVAVQTAAQVASAVIEVDALNEPVRKFYERYGFSSLADDQQHLYLPMADAKALVQQVFGGAEA